MDEPKDQRTNGPTDRPLIELRRHIEKGHFSTSAKEKTCTRARMYKHTGSPKRLMCPPPRHHPISNRMNRWKYRRTNGRRDGRTDHRCFSIVFLFDSMMLLKKKSSHNDIFRGMKKRNKESIERPQNVLHFLVAKGWQRV